MSAPAARQDATLSAASFLASINAESSTSFGSDVSTSAAKSTPSLPISAKVALIDAQIESLEARIEQTITTHAAVLRERAGSTRTVDRNLNQLWRSVNQTNSRIVTIGPQLTPIASEYHEALAQSSKQRLLISVLSDLLAATRQLEVVEKLQRQPESSTFKDQLALATNLMQPFRSSPALQNLPAVLELQTRLDRLEKESTKSSSSRQSTNTIQEAPPDQVRATTTSSISKHMDVPNVDNTPALSPALKVLEAARAIIVSRDAQAGWKEIRIELDAPSPPPPDTFIPAPQASLPKMQPSTSSIDARPEHMLSEEMYPGSASLTRTSSSSSASNARSRHKPRLGARVIRPQDQLGSGPFNAQDTSLDGDGDGDGWGLDEDDEDLTDAPHAASTNTAAHQSHPALIAGLPIHQSVASLARDERFGSPSSSVVMQRSMSSASSQQSALAMQEPASHREAADSNDVDAWGLGEDESNDEADAWDLNDDNVMQQSPESPNKTRASVLPLNGSVTAPSLTVAAPAHDAWGVQDGNADADDDPWETEEPSKQTESAVNTTVAASARQSNAELSFPDADEPLETADQPEQSAAQLASRAAGSAPTSTPQLQHDLIPSSSTALEGNADTFVLVTEQIKPSAQAQQGPTLVASHDAEQKVEVTRSTSFVAEVPASVEAAQVFEQPIATGANEDEAEEQDADAWGFEESSSASEADRAELAPITPLQKQTALEKLAAQEASTVKTKAVSAPSAAAVSVKSTRQDSQARESDIASSSSSPSGWGEDFSDPESIDVPASGSHEKRAAQPNTNRIASSIRSVSRDRESVAGTAAGDAQKLSNATPSAATELKEECTISQRSLDLVNLAESTMSSVLAKLQGGHATDGDEDKDNVEALAGTVFKIFELHRALMPVAHGEVLRDVPSLAMQFFNDCEYLARELSRLVADKGGDIATAWIAHDMEAAKRWKSKELVKLEQEATMTRSLGQRWFEAQMTAQTKILLDTLMEADGFARTFDDHRFARCERCIKQVVQTLQQLSKAWRPVLVTSRFHAAIGRLVDLVFQKILHDVLDLEDIGESESEKIASLVKTLGSLESLFTAEGAEEASAAPLWVPSWFKTSYLIEILTGSLVDIEFLAFEAGALVDYSRKELTVLIKALFADTPNRAKLLRRIESAPVEVLAH